jgi:hypothetical protein
MDGAVTVTGERRPEPRERPRAPYTVFPSNDGSGGAPWATDIRWTGYLGDAYPDLGDPRTVEALESIPYDERVAVESTYEALRIGVSLAPDDPAIHFLLRGEPDEDPLTLTYRQYLGRVNLLHDRGVGPRDVVSFLLPLLPHSYMVLFGAEAAGIVNPVNPMLEVRQIAASPRVPNRGNMGLYPIARRATAE